MDEGEEGRPVERMSPFTYLMRRITGPAVAIVVLYASMFALPSLLANQAPPVDGRDLLRVFALAFVGFAVLAVVLDYRAKRKDPS